MESSLLDFTTHWMTSTFPLPLGVWEGLRFVIVVLPGLFSYLFFNIVNFPYLNSNIPSATAYGVYIAVKTVILEPALSILSNEEDIAL